MVKNHIFWQHFVVWSVFLHLVLYTILKYVLFISMYKMWMNDSSISVTCIYIFFFFYWLHKFFKLQPFTFLNKLETWTWSLIFTNESCSSRRLIFQIRHTDIINIESQQKSSEKRIKWGGIGLSNYPILSSK